MITVPMDARSTEELAAYPELSDDEWTGLVERLTLHAACRIRTHTWRGLRITQGGSVPGGVDPADLACEAITDVIEGKRIWNQDTESDFLAFLRSVVDSKVSHLVEGLENRITRRTAAGSGDTEFDRPGREPNPLMACMDKDSLERLRAAIVKEIQGDKLVEGLFGCLAEEETKPANIAVLLDVTVKDVNNGQKRLKRKVESLLKNTQKG
jgi:hypothetical protein